MFFLIIQNNDPTGQRELAKNKRKKKMWIGLRTKKIFITKKQAAAPALKAADNIGSFTFKKGFDWNSPAQVIKKVEEELNELKTELDNGKENQKEVQEELGDLIFSIAQLSRHLGFCPEETLKQANEKFQHRYNKMVLKNNDKDISPLSRAKKEELWNSIKKEENRE